MSKWTILLGLIVVGVFLTQLDAGRITISQVSNVIISSSVTSPQIDEPPALSDENLDILAFGDLMIGRYVRTLMDKNGKDYIFEKLGDIKNLSTKNEDIFFANLEGPIKGEGYHNQTAMVFGFNEDSAPFLKEKGFNLLSIANNHAFDQSKDGRDTTIKALNDNNMGYCGHPSEADAESVYYGNIGDQKFAFICFNDVVFPLDDVKALELVKSVRPNVDFLIVSIHWGVEYAHKPNKKMQIDFGHQLIDNGVDLIIGHHPHVVQPFEVYKDRVIFYSLGNFVFDQYWSRDTQEELAVAITLSKDGEKLKTDFELIPLKSEKSQVRLMTDEEKTAWLEKFIGYGDFDEEMKKLIRSAKISVQEK